MQTRTLGRTRRTVSVIGLGTWQLGADWGDVDEAEALAVLDAAHEAGVTFFDTADVYGDGRSETLIGRWLREHPGSGVTVATKMGRRMPQEHENYSLEHFRAWTDRSRANLGVETLDLVQLHCPPTSVYSDDRVFDALDTLVDEGAIANYGVSVEKVEEALTAIARPHVASVQIILNAFRLKPLDEVLPAARRGRRGHHRPRAARQRAAVGPVHARHAVRRERPPHLQPPRRVVRRRRDLLGRRLRDRACGRRGSSPSSPARRHRMPRPPRWRSRGSPGRTA